LGFVGYLIVHCLYYNNNNNDSRTIRKSSYQTSTRPGSGEFFDGIASMYDATNRVMTFGLDMSWRQKMIDQLSLNQSFAQSPQFLDLATGTGDVAILLTKAFLKLSSTSSSHSSDHTTSISSSTNQIKQQQQQKSSTSNKNKGIHPLVTALDPSSKMISYGQEKVKHQGLSDKIQFILGNSEKLPFSDKQFDRITMSFGIRNVEFRNKALHEIKRVLRQDGILGIMEFSSPQKGILKIFGDVFIQYIMPVLAGLFTAGRYAEYMYLRDSILLFPSPIQFRDVLVDEIGFTTCEIINAFQHIVFIYICKK